MHRLRQIEPRTIYIYIYIYISIYIYIYTYIYIYIYIVYNRCTDCDASFTNTGGRCAAEVRKRRLLKRGLEHGVRAPVFYGNVQEQTGENGFPRIPTGSLFCSYRNLRKSPETSGSLRDNVIKESCTPVPSYSRRRRLSGYFDRRVSSCSSLPAALGDMGIGNDCSLRLRAKRLIRRPPLQEQRTVSCLCVSKAKQNMGIGKGRHSGIPAAPVCWAL